MEEKNKENDLRDVKMFYENIINNLTALQNLSDSFIVNRKIDEVFKDITKIKEELLYLLK